MAVVLAAALSNSFLPWLGILPQRPHAKSDPLGQLMRIHACAFAFAKSALIGALGSTHTLYIRLWKKCHPKYQGA